MRAHQFYLTRKEIKDRLALPETAGGDASPSTTFQVVDPKKQKVETDWSKLGQGQSLAANRSSQSDNTQDSDLAAALAQSLKDVPLTEPPPEPSADEPASTIVQLMVRFPSGARQMRKFSLVKSTIADVFVWLQYVGAKSVTPPVVLDGEFSLVGTMDKRGTKIVRSRDGRLSFTSEQGTDPSPRGDPKDVTLSSLGLVAGQEAFNLQYI